MTIYCIGCSHTEGTGLADYKFFQNDYPGEISLEQLDSVTWTNKRSKILFQNPVLFEMLRQENLKKAWPAHLSNFTGKKVINAGVGGASISSMSMSLLYDLDNLSKEQIEIDKVIVALPTVARLPLINKEPFEGYHTLAFKNVLPSFLDNVKNEYRNYCKGFFESHSDEEMLTFYFYHCLSIKNTVKTLTGKDPIFVATYDFTEWRDTISNSKIYLLHKYWEMLDFDRILDQQSFYSFSKNSKLLPDGHFPEQVHKEFAKYIKDTFL